MGEDWYEKVRLEDLIYLLFPEDELDYLDIRGFMYSTKRIIVSDGYLKVLKGEIDYKTYIEYIHWSEGIYFEESTKDVEYNFNDIEFKIINKIVEKPYEAN